MGQYVKVDNAEGLVRDLSTGAILNYNLSEYEKRAKLKKAEAERRHQIEMQQQEINCIKGELCEIKQMLLQLISSKS